TKSSPALSFQMPFHSDIRHSKFTLMSIPHVKVSFFCVTKQLLVPIDFHIMENTVEILVGSSMGGWLMLLAAIARPEKTKALVGISTAADHFVTAFKTLPIEVRKECEDKGVWTIPTKSNKEGMYTVSMDFLREAENHCILQSPIPITCPVRLIHGLKDKDVPWHISMQVAERVLSPDVDVILRRHGQHRMAEKDDIKLIVYTIDDLIDKLTTMV
uniref:Mycophenolic acid acyl-glucuronide esterase, mitochondrial-like n=1 Tax=Sinocyclocheilus grahami TaxID=75366 RepID=A0A672RWK8_SINGR